MSEGPAFNNPEQPIERSSQQEVLREQVDALLEDYFLLMSQRGLDSVDQKILNQNIDEKRQELIAITQDLNSQIELDNVFSQQVDNQLDLADKGIETGKEELDGRDNIETYLGAGNEYFDKLYELDVLLDKIKGSTEKKEEKEEELEQLIFVLKTLIRSLINVGKEINQLILSLNIDNKKELTDRHVKTMNEAFRVIANIQDTDETIDNLEKLKKLKKDFDNHLDEILHLYEELRDISKDNK